MNLNSYLVTSLFNNSENVSHGVKCVSFHKCVKVPMCKDQHRPYCPANLLQHFLFLEFKWQSKHTPTYCLTHIPTQNIQPLTNFYGLKENTV